MDRIYLSSAERSKYSVGIELLERLAKEVGVETAHLLKTPKADDQAGSRVPPQLTDPPSRLR